MELHHTVASFVVADRASELKYLFPILRKLMANVKGPAYLLAGHQYGLRP
jgi:hypothetical protein